MTWQRFFYSPIGIVIGCIVLFLLARGAWDIHQKALLAEQRLDQAKTELSDLERQQQSLSSSINQLSTPAGIEAELREKYHAVKEGESVAVIVDQASSSEIGVATNSSSTPELSWWGDIMQFIGL